METAVVCIIWQFRAFCCTSVKKAKCVLIYRLYDEMNLRCVLVVTPGFSCRIKQKCKVSSLKSLAFLKWKMLMYFPDMHFTSPEFVPSIFNLQSCIPVRDCHHISIFHQTNFFPHDHSKQNQLSCNGEDVGDRGVSLNPLVYSPEKMTTMRAYFLPTLSLFVNNCGNSENC